MDTNLDIEMSMFIYEHGRHGSHGGRNDQEAGERFNASSGRIEGNERLAMNLQSILAALRVGGWNGENATATISGDPEHDEGVEGREHVLRGAIADFAISVKIEDPSIDAVYDSFDGDAPEGSVEFNSVGDDCIEVHVRYLSSGIGDPAYPDVVDALHAADISMQNVS